MTKIKLLFIILLSVFSLQLTAAEKAETGFKLEVKVSGFFSPEVSSAKVKSVVEFSQAAEQGVEVGDQLLAINGCEIPGCSASKAKKALSQEPGTNVLFDFRKADGTEYQAEVALY